MANAHGLPQSVSRPFQLGLEGHMLVSILTQLEDWIITEQRQTLVRLLEELRRGGRPGNERRTLRLRWDCALPRDRRFHLPHGLLHE